MLDGVIISLPNHKLTHTYIQKLWSTVKIEKLSQVKTQNCTWNHVLLHALHRQLDIGTWEHMGVINNPFCQTDTSFLCIFKGGRQLS